MAVDCTRSLAELKQISDPSIAYEPDRPFKDQLRVVDELRRRSIRYRHEDNLEMAYICLSKAVGFIFQKLPVHSQYDILTPQQKTDLANNGVKMQRIIDELEPKLLVRHQRWIESHEKKGNERPPEEPPPSSGNVPSEAIPRTPTSLEAKSTSSAASRPMPAVPVMLTAEQERQRIGERDRSRPTKESLPTQPPLRSQIPTPDSTPNRQSSSNLAPSDNESSVRASLQAAHRKLDDQLAYYNRWKPEGLSAQDYEDYLRLIDHTAKSEREILERRCVGPLAYFKEREMPLVDHRRQARRTDFLATVKLAPDPPESLRPAGQPRSNAPIAYAQPSTSGSHTPSSVQSSAPSIDRSSRHSRSSPPPSFPYAPVPHSYSPSSSQPSTPSTGRTSYPSQSSTPSTYAPNPRTTQSMNMPSHMAALTLKTADVHLGANTLHLGASPLSVESPTRPRHAKLGSPDEAPTYMNKKPSIITMPPTGQPLYSITPGRNMNEHQYLQGYSPSPTSMFKAPPKGAAPPVNNSLGLMEHRSARHDARSGNRSSPALRPIHLPMAALRRFMSSAAINTSQEKETCGILLGKDQGDSLHVQTLLLPRQHGTKNTCTMTHEELVVEFQEARGYMQLGWIHTHPTQSCFMSSMDLHTHAAYQKSLPEAIAIVCAPNSAPQFGIFRLTNPGGLSLILECKLAAAFHPHSDSQPIYTDADSDQVRMLEDANIEIIDLR